jgi:hypothetical protein
MKRLLVTMLTASSVVGCATLTEDAMTPIAMSFSDGSRGECNLTNKRGAWPTEIPTTVSVRKSDDALKYECETYDGREAFGAIESTMGAKIVASAVFIDFGITDAITDKHRQYPANFVIPIEPKQDDENSVSTVTGPVSRDTPEQRENVNEDLETLNDLRDRGVLTDAEFEAEKKRLLEEN